VIKRENKDKKNNECYKGIYRVRKVRRSVHRVLYVSRVKRTVQHIQILRAKLVPQCGTCTVNKQRGKCTEVYSTNPQSGSGTSTERCYKYVNVKIVKNCIKVRYEKICNVLSVKCGTKDASNITLRVEVISKRRKGKWKMYNHKYDMYGYIVALWTGSIKVKIEGSAASKKYAVRYVKSVTRRKNTAVKRRYERKYEKYKYDMYGYIVALWRGSIKVKIEGSAASKKYAVRYVKSVTRRKSTAVKRRYECKYEKYRCYTAAGAGSIKVPIDGKAGCKIYIQHKCQVMTYEGHKPISESIEASIEEKCGGNKYIETAELGKNSVDDKRYLRNRGKATGSIRLGIEEQECKDKYRKHAKDSGETLISVSEKMDQGGAGNNPEMMGNVPQQAATTGEYYLTVVPSYSRLTRFDMLMFVTTRAYKPSMQPTLNNCHPSVIVCAYKLYVSSLSVICPLLVLKCEYKPYMLSILNVCIMLHVYPLPSLIICVNSMYNIMKMVNVYVLTYSKHECRLSNIYVSLLGKVGYTLCRKYMRGNWCSRYRE
jgi:hypothetical protein